MVADRVPEAKAVAQLMQQLIYPELGKLGDLLGKLRPFSSMPWPTQLLKDSHLSMS